MKELDEDLKNIYIYINEGMFNFDLKFISIKRRLRTQKLTEGQRRSNVFQKVIAD